MIKLFAAAAVLAGLLAPTTAAHADTAPTRFLATGDSVTSGWRGDYTWRYFFSTARPDVDMVGNKTGTTDWGNWDYNGTDAYADPNFDQGHAATFGGRLGDEAPQPEWGQLPISTLSAAYQPDVIAGLWGANDLPHGTTPQELVGIYEAWITAARSEQPDVDFIIGQLPQVWRDQVPEFNALLPGLAEQMTTDRSRVVIATARDFTGADTVDGIHPTVEGQAKITSMMLEALSVLETPIAAQEPTPETPSAPVPPAAPQPAPAPARPIVTTPAEIARLEAPRGVKAVRHGARVVVAWRAVAAAERYVVKCGRTSKTVDRTRVRVVTPASACRVRSVNPAGASSWTKVRVRG